MRKEKNKKLGGSQRWYLTKFIEVAILIASSINPKNELGWNPNIIHLKLS
ncbi:hypothetical protein KTC92_14880 [Clostridium sp. CM027]|nr:hypothetical protein [Clostridium sp. CM027]MBW9145265.1 hypothetical protein [Clostridium sp. CM027]UVE40395.1 hypothetical protein KTC92_14880 [Clostridium sp. CM027]